VGVRVRGASVSAFHIQVDPHAVLGVAPGASLGEIREAYRSKAKRYHPDAGGEDWAFRALVQSYEVLSRSRVARATRAEPGGRPMTPRAPRGGTETSRARDCACPPDPSRLVTVEKLWVRHEAEHVWLLQDGPRDDTFLSCCLNLSWPDPALAGAPAADGPGTERALRLLAEVFDEMCTLTRVVASRRQAEGGRFSAWLSYGDAPRACAALRLLKGALHARGFDVKQWNRDLIIPRGWT
jgi:hypothetical protein